MKSLEKTSTGAFWILHSVRAVNILYIPHGLHVVSNWFCLHAHDVDFQIIKIAYFSLYLHFCSTFKPNQWNNTSIETIIFTTIQIELLHIFASILKLW